MRSRRLERGDSRVDSPVVIAALLGVLLGSSASLWVQRSSASHICAPADCMTCPVCTASTAVAERVAAIPASYPVGGTWRPAEREGKGDAELQAVLKRVAINDEVLVAGARAAVVNALQRLQRSLPRWRAVSNNALITPDGTYGMLATWVESVRRTGVKNFMVIAMDEHTGACCRGCEPAHPREIGACYSLLTSLPSAPRPSQPEPWK